MAKISYKVLDRSGRQIYFILIYLSSSNKTYFRLLCQVLEQ